VGADLTVFSIKSSATLGCFSFVQRIEEMNGYANKTNNNA
jgi:hypothetical protein